MTNAHYVIPKLVEDASLKRARTTITEGGEEKEAIQVTQVGGSLDSQGVADGLALAPSSVVSGSATDTIRRIEVNTLYLNEINNVLGTDSDIKIDSSQDGTVSSRIRQLSSDTAHIFSDVGQLLAATGSRSDSAWSGTGSGTLNEIAKRTSNDTHAAADVLGTQSDADVFPNRDGSINGRVRYISNAITTIDSNNYKTAEAAGTQSDPAWSGSGDGTVIALLKGIYNKL